MESEGGGYRGTDPDTDRSLLTLFFVQPLPVNNLLCLSRVIEKEIQRICSMRIGRHRGKFAVEEMCH